MSMLKGALAAAAMAVSAAVPALAADGGMDDGMAWVLNTDGKYATGKLSQMGLAEMMRAAKPLPGGAVIFMHQGKLYYMDDPKGSAYQMRRDMMMSGT